MGSNCGHGEACDSRGEAVLNAKRNNDMVHYEIKEPEAKAKENWADYRKNMEHELKVWPFSHRGSEQLGLKYKNGKIPYDILKKLNAKYTSTHRCYYVAHNKKNFHLIFDSFKGKAWVDISLLKTKKVKDRLNNERKKRSNVALNPEHKAELEKFKNYLNARRLAQSTIKTYGSLVYAFLAYFNHVPIKNIDDEMVKEFLAADVKSRGYSNSYQRQMLSSIKLFYSERFDHKLKLDKLPNVKIERKLPKVLAMSEIKNILESITNLKHRTLLSLCYACGLRISEALNLKLVNVDSERMVIEILAAKGGKDRIVPISDNILKELRDYYKAYKPQVYLFEGAKKGERYTAVSANSVLKTGAKKAGLKKPVHMHMLRHSYATHLLESGVDTRYIQKLLGHKSTKTTEVYTFVSNEKLDKITSPFDRLGLDDK